MFIVVSRYKVSEGLNPTEVEQLLRKLRKEDAEVSEHDERGCLEFSVYQENDDPRAWLLYERYRSEDAFKAHQQTPHFKDIWKKQVEPDLAMTFSVQIS